MIEDKQTHIFRILWVFGMGVVGNELAKNSKANAKAALREIVMAEEGGRAYDVILYLGGIFQAGQQTPVSELIYQEVMTSRPTKPQETHLRETSSTTTRDNILRGKVALRRQDFVPKLHLCQHTIISEKWHLLLIQLLMRIHGIPTTPSPSGYRAKPKEVMARLPRFLFYLIDPIGKGWFSRQETKRRRKAASS